MPNVLPHPGLRIKSLFAEHTILHMIPPYGTVSCTHHIDVLCIGDSVMILHHDVHAVRDGGLPVPSPLCRRIVRLRNQLLSSGSQELSRTSRHLVVP
jgi:hypothetical protein